MSQKRDKNGGSRSIGASSASLKIASARPRGVRENRENLQAFTGYPRRGGRPGISRNTDLKQERKRDRRSGSNQLAGKGKDERGHKTTRREIALQMCPIRGLSSQGEEIRHDFSKRTRGGDRSQQDNRSLPGTRSVRK